MTARSIVSTDIWLLSALVTMFWCMSSACRIHLHANFLHFLPHQTFTMIHILPFTQQTRWEESLRMDLLVSLWLFVHRRVSDGLVASAKSDGRNRGSNDGATSVYASVLIYLLSRCCVQSCVCSFRSSRKFLHLWFPAPLFRALGPER